MASRPPLRPILRSIGRQRPCKRISSCLRAPSQSRCQSSSAAGGQDGTAGADDAKDRKTHFGFETVTEAEKTERVAGVFTSVAESYDRMNDLMSFGWHRVWKDHFVRGLYPALIPPLRPLSSPPSSPSSPSSQPRPIHILDIAGGTGDIAFRLLRAAHALDPAHSPSTLRVTVSDINPAMLAVGRARARAATQRLTAAQRASLGFLEADATALGGAVPDASVDVYTVAFGIRNFTSLEAGLREAYRVLRPGGLFACLEFGKVVLPSSSSSSSSSSAHAAPDERLGEAAPSLDGLARGARQLLDAAYKRWSFSAIPLIGQVVAGDRDSYQYLVESIERFPPQDRFRDMIREAGFEVPGRPGWEDLTGGVAAIHKGVKPLNG